MVALDYATTGWLAFYLPKGTCVAQFRQRIRWVNMPEPNAVQLAGKLLYVYQAWLGDAPLLKDRFVRIDRVSEVQRKRGPLVIETFVLDLLEAPRARYSTALRLLKFNETHRETHHSLPCGCDP